MIILLILRRAIIVDDQHSPNKSLSIASFQLSSTPFMIKVCSVLIHRSVINACSVQYITPI
jgi:hypothetical protein